MTFGRCGASPTILEGKKEQDSEMHPAERDRFRQQESYRSNAPAEEVAAAHIESAVPDFKRHPEMNSRGARLWLLPRLGRQSYCISAPGGLFSRPIARFLPWSAGVPCPEVRRWWPA